jgi:hypothetical protein
LPSDELHHLADLDSKGAATSQRASKPEELVQAGYCLSVVTQNTVSFA